MSKEKYLRLNLGCGIHHFEGWLNVDKEELLEPDMQVDLEEPPWPWDDDSVNEVRFIHSLEHLGDSPRTFAQIMQELYRVCRHGAHIYIAAAHPRHDSFINDPTACHPVTASSLQYFDKSVNLKWKEQGALNTLAALTLGVDFRIVSFKLIVDENFTKHARAKKWSNEDLRNNLNLYNNAVSATELHLVVIKDRTDERYAMAAPLSVEPYLMQIHPDLQQDAVVSRAIATTGIFEPTQTAVLSKTVRALSKDKKKLLVANAGANIGWYALLCAKLSPAVSVDCFEPVPQNLELLKRNADLNLLTDRLNIQECALGAQSAESVKLYMGKQLSEASFDAKEDIAKEAKEEQPAASVLEVKGECWDSFYKGRQLARIPELVVLDVNGAEQEVLTGSGKLFERGWRPVIFLKFNAAAIKRISSDFTLADTLQNLGYTVYVINPKALNLSELKCEQLKKTYEDLSAPKFINRHLNLLLVPEGVDVKTLVA